MEDRKQTLLAKAESRRLSLVVGLAPAGAGKLNEMPTKKDAFAATFGHVKVPITSDVVGQSRTSIPPNPNVMSYGTWLQQLETRMAIN